MFYFQLTWGSNCSESHDFQTTRTCYCSLRSLWQAAIKWCLRDVEQASQQGRLDENVTAEIWGWNPLCGSTMFTDMQACTSACALMRKTTNWRRLRSSTTLWRFWIDISAMLVSFSLPFAPSCLTITHSLPLEQYLFVFGACVHSAAVGNRQQPKWVWNSG